ncbi:response regulator receiver domain [Flagellimonas sp. S3867]|uniref:response regulator receiver domain n=1 Tax=Flagellimonas sp. S3867 TaxID=2768063 RepID=UPI001684BCD5|nr:response regulator receiver domain [Flagellimonas sp. S3867]
MSSTFFESSKEIANDFLQSIVFIDDRAFLNEDPNHHEFDAQQITRIFANSKKVCAVYNPESLEDINNLALLAKKTDITVLDWQINIAEEEVKVENEEEDADNDDPRGPHTRKIIRGILSDPLTGKGSLKLIVIYTGELDLPGITDEIFNDLQALEIQGLQKGDCCVFTTNIKILVAAKPASNDGSGKPKFKHNPELNSKVINYDELPDFILTQFTELTSGLLTNFVLQSLTAIRNNTFRLIKLYKKELDPSFLSHRLLLTNPEDSKEQVIEILSHSIQAILNYNETGEAVSSSNIFEWIDTKKFEEKLEIIKDKKLVISGDFIKDWITTNFVEACKKQWVANGFSDEQHAPIGKFVKRERELYKTASEFFIGQPADDIDSEFSILTHHKSNLKQPSSLPRLTLGTLVKQLPLEKDQEERFFLCIQARCDSVRLGELRKFLFLPLEKVDRDSKFHFVTEDNSEFIRLNIVKDAFELRTIKFQPSEKNQVVQAEESKSQFYFKSNHDEHFQWLADLKDAHAQREANNFAAKISRVGLDESEWLRRWGN